MNKPISKDNPHRDIGKSKYRVRQHYTTWVEYDVIAFYHYHISAGTALNGDEKIGERTFIVSRTFIKKSVKIVSNCFIRSHQKMKRNVKDFATIK